MFIQTQAEYQNAIQMADTYFSKGVSNLTTEEKEQLNKILKAIELYQFRTDPLPVVTSIP
jgi:hypothetical protein